LTTMQNLRKDMAMRMMAAISVWLGAWICSGPAGTSNSIPWTANFNNYTNLTPLVNGTGGWYASSSSVVIQTNFCCTNLSGISLNAVMLPTDVTLSNRFSNSFTRVVKLGMQICPQLYNATNSPTPAMNVAAQFYVNSNGCFVVSNGTNWQTLNWRNFSLLSEGGSALPVTNTFFTYVEVNLRYKNHTWNLKAWSNETLIASSPYVHFTSNLNSFGGFDIYNGSSTSYLNDVFVTNVDVSLLPAINYVSFDAVESVCGAAPAEVNNVVLNE